MVCHATYFLTVSFSDVTGARGQATTMRLLADCADVSPSLLLLRNQPRRGVRVTMPRDLMYPFPLDALRVPAVILLPRDFSCCSKLLPTIMLPS